MPWLFWSLLYGLAKVVKVVFTEAQLKDVFDKTMIFTGPRVHLWFLPFAFVVSVPLIFIVRKINNKSNSRCIFWGSVISVISVFCYSIVNSKFSLPCPFIQWFLAMPAIPLGFVIGRSLLISNPVENPF